MQIKISLNRREWVALLVMLLFVLTFVYFFTPVFRGHAVEVSVENTGPDDVFAHIDSTGRHGPSAETTVLRTSTNSVTPPGELVRAGQTRSFGMAVGIFDSPTVHIWNLTTDSRAQAEPVRDCPFDTVLFKFQLPSTHVKVIWTGRECLIAN